MNFSAYFLIQCIHIKRIFKTISHFSYLPAIFEKLANISGQQLLLNHILKECLTSKDLQIIRKKKTDTVLISVYLSCTTENFKVILQCIWDLDLAKYNTLQPIEKTWQEFHKTSCFNFYSGI